MNINFINALKKSKFSVDDISILSKTQRSLISDYAFGHDIPDKKGAEDLAELLGKPIDFLFADFKEYFEK